MSTAKGLTIRKFVLTGMFTAIICVISQIVIPIQPIPFSLSFLAIFLIGILLEPKYAFFSIMAYIFLGAFGLPVFAGFKGGFHVITGMTGGFIMAYPIMGFVTSIFYQLSRKIKATSFMKKIAQLAIATLGIFTSIVICYTIGTLWFSYITGKTLAYSFTVCVLPFIFFDLIKMALALAFGPVLRSVLSKLHE